MQTTIPATKARKQFFKLIEEASKPGSSAIITVDGEPKVIMMSFEDWEEWMETFEVISDPQLVKGIEEGIEDIKAGRVVSWEEIKKSHNL